MIYLKPNVFFFELKSTHYKSVSFQRTEKDNGMIKLDQINSLIKLNSEEGTRAGFVFNFRIDEEGQPYSETSYYMGIEEFSNFYNDTDKKSISRLDVVQYGGIMLDGVQKRKYYVYDIKKLLKDINDKEEGY